MRTKSLFIFALFLLQAYSVTRGPFYHIDNTRFNNLLSKMNLLSGDHDDQDGLLEEYVLSFAFNCEQVLALISTYKNEYYKAFAVEILQRNIIDPQNKAIILDSFQKASNKGQASGYFNNMFPCEVVGPALPQIPTAELPYKDQWNQKDLENLIKTINKATSSEKKLQIAEDAITSSSSFLTPEQACLLYESFSYSDDMLALTEFVKDRLVGLTCNQITSILIRFFFQRDRLEILKAFKGSIIDVENKLTLLDSFVSASMKTEAQKILEDVHAKNDLFGSPAGKVLFLIDISETMSAGLIFNNQKTTRFEFVKKELEKTLSSLDSDTQFNILFYDEEVETWKADLQKATKNNVVDAIKWADKRKIGEYRDMYSALQTAWKMKEVETIYFLSDGYPSEGETDTTVMLADLKKWYTKTPIKVNTIAFLMGSHVVDNKPTTRKLMKSIAEATKGTYKAVESEL